MRLAVERDALRASGLPLGRAKPLRLGPVVLGLDLCIMLGASVGANELYHRLVIDTVGDLQVSAALGLGTFVYFAALFGHRANYAFDSLTSVGRQLREITLVWVLVAILVVTLAFLLKLGPNVSRGATLGFFATGWAGLCLVHGGLAHVVHRAQARAALARAKVLVVSAGDGRERRQAAAALEENGVQVARVIALTPGADLARLAAEVTKAVESEAEVESIVVSLPRHDPEILGPLLAALRAVPLPIRLLPGRDLAGLLAQPVVRVGTLRAVELARGPLGLDERLLKRAFDVAVSAGLLVLLAPALLVAALLVAWDSRGPVFFTQTRNGFGNRPFRIVKFRTLTSLDDGAVVRQVTPDDERRTRVGAVLRRTSIDELPQLLNVLRGEMSLVGPRPHAAAHNSDYAERIARYADRHHVKPGMTGWAQVNGARGLTASDDDMARRVELDLWYLNNWSFGLDLAILARTVLVLLRPGAY